MCEVTIYFGWLFGVGKPKVMFLAFINASNLMSIT